MADDLEEIESKFTIRKVVISEQELEKLSLAISQENLSNQERGKRYSTSRTQSQRSHKPTNVSAIRPEIDSELDTGGLAIASKLDQTKQLLNEVSVSGEQIEMDQNICSEDNIRPPEESGMKEHESGVPIRTRKERKTREGFGLYQVKKGKFSDKLSNAESNKASTNKDKARKADTLQKRTKNAKRDTEVGEQRHGHEQQQKNDKSSPRQKARPSAKFKTDQFHRSSKSEVEFHESHDTGGNVELQKRKMQGKRLSYSIDDGNVDHSYPEHDNEERTPVRTKYIDDWDFTDSSHLVQLNFDSETNDPLHPESDELFHIKKTNIPFEKLKLDKDFYKLSASGNLSSSSGEASDPIKDCVSGKQREKRQKHTKVSIAGNIEAQESDLSSNNSDELKPDMKPCLEENYPAVNGEDNMRGVNSNARESKAGRGRAQRKPLKDPQSGSDRMYFTEKKRIRRRDIEDIQKFSSHNEKKGSMSTNMSSTHSNNEGLKVANHPKVERNNTKNKDLKRNNSIGQYINESEDWDLDDDVSDLSVELRKDQDSLVISSDGEEQHKSMDAFVDNISESDVIECREREIEKDPIISDTKTIDKILNSDLQSGMSEAIKDLHNIKGDVDKQSHEIESGKSLEFTQKVAGIIVLPSSAILNESATNKNCESVTFNEVPSSEKFTTAMKLNNDNRNIMTNSKVEPANFPNRPITITAERSGNLIPPANVLLQTVKDTTHLISNLLSRGLSNTNKIVKALDLSLKIQNAYRELILKHPTIAWKYDAENLLWKQAYHSLISIFRMNLDKKNQLHPVLYRSLTEHYWMFLHNGCKFLEDLLVALQQEHQFDLYELIEIPYVRKSVSKQVMFLASLFTVI